MNLIDKQLNNIISCAQNILKNAGIDEYECDSYLLAEHVFGINRQKYHMNPSAVMDDNQTEEYFRLINMRAERKPLQYIIGKCEFMGFSFAVNTDVLIPRQDTEILVECAVKSVKELCKKRDILPEQLKILDMCTGSGCIGISIAKITNAHVTCADISEGALKCAKQNGERLYNENIRFVQSDLFENISGEFDVIVSNPPYVVHDEIKSLMPEVSLYEPCLALDGGKDGLIFYRRIVENADRYLTDSGVLLFEIGSEQAEEVCAILKENRFKNTEVIKDLAGLDRVIKAGRE